MKILLHPNSQFPIILMLKRAKEFMLALKALFVFRLEMLTQLIN